MYSDDEENFFDNYEEDYEDPNEIGQEFKAFKGLVISVIIKRF